uniref:Uncharacterized protein n=1 Tax=Romanomermis culicivorax TaxID=13658 RepID=A0A915L0E0_ROMCU
MGVKCMDWHSRPDAAWKIPAVNVEASRVSICKSEKCEEHRYVGILDQSGFAPFTEHLDAKCQTKFRISKLT